MLPNQLLAAKLLVLYLAARNVLERGWPIRKLEVYLPLLPFLDAVRECEWLPLALGMFFGAASLALILNWHVRAACVLLGSLQCYFVVADSSQYSNSAFLFGCLWLLVGLQDRERGRFLIRGQIVLVYLGAGLNKLLDPDWRDGQFVEFWTREVLDHRMFQSVADAMPEGLVATSLGWLVILAELGLAIAFLRPQWTERAILAGIGFHGGLLVFTGGALSVVFFFLMSVSYLALVRWPEDPIRISAPSSSAPWLYWWTRLGDVEGRFEWRPSNPPESLHVRAGDQMWSGVKGRGVLLLLNPLTYITGTILLLGVRYGPAYVDAFIRILVG